MPQPGRDDQAALNVGHQGHGLGISQDADSQDAQDGHQRSSDGKKGEVGMMAKQEKN